MRVVIVIAQCDPSVCLRLLKGHKYLMIMVSFVFKVKKRRK